MSPFLMKTHSIHFLYIFHLQFSRYNFLISIQYPTWSSQALDKLKSQENINSLFMLVNNENRDLMIWNSQWSSNIDEKIFRMAFSFVISFREETEEIENGNPSFLRNIFSVEVSSIFYVYLGTRRQCSNEFFSQYVFHLFTFSNKLLEWPFSSLDTPQLNEI